MIYRVIAEATMAVHFLFLVYVTLGGFLAWRWPWTIWLHLACVLWGFSTVLVGIDCPLTYVENWARLKAGQAGLSTGFIDTYLEGVVYPEKYSVHLRFLVAIIVQIGRAHV